MAQPVGGNEPWGRDPGPPRWLGVLLAWLGGLALVPIVLLILAGLILSSMGVGSCDFDFRADRDDCSGSDSALVRASVQRGGGAVTKELEHSHRPNQADDHGNLALPCAAMVGNRKAVEALLAAGADATRSGYTGGRPIVAAVSGEGRSGNEPEASDKVAFAPIDSVARTDIVQILAAHGAPPTPALSAAAEKGLSRSVDALLEAGANPSGDPAGPSPLLSAVFGNHPSIVRVLLRHHADPNHGGLISGTDLMRALGSVLQQSMFALQKYAPDPTSHGSVPPLVAAARRCSR